MTYRWSESASRYEPTPLINRHFLGNMAFLISLGVAEELVTGEVADCGVSYLSRLAMLQPRAPAPASEAEAVSRSPAAAVAVSRLRPRLRPNVGHSS